MSRIGPLLTAKVHEQLRIAAEKRDAEVECSLDLERSRTRVRLERESWSWQDRQYPLSGSYKDRTIYYWSGDRFEPISRYTDCLIKLIPTEWGAPTFEIDGIKMLPTAKVSPYEDARQKVILIEPNRKVILDTCGGLGYFAAWCLTEGASRVCSYEKNPSVVWLRSLNPWSPEHSEPDDGRLQLTQGSILDHIESFASGSVAAVLHDPPRFGIAGELYSQSFYDDLARVLKRRGRLFHYTGTPNKLTSGRDVPREIAARLQRAGFTTQLKADGVLATKK